MSNVTTEWILELVDKITGPIRSVTAVTERLENEVRQLTERFDQMGNEASQAAHEIADGMRNANRSMSIVAAQAGSQAIQQLGQPFVDGAEGTYKFNSALKELESITGVSSDAIEQIGDNARATSLKFGGDAADKINGYTILLSKLTPEIAKNPEALNKMGNSVGMLAETMKGDLVAASNSASAAVNQFGVDMSDPVKLAEEMDKMLNMMVASAKVGSQDVPVVARAIEETGSMAKNANVHFAETNAALQVLGKFGKEGAEGGIALRNVLSILQKQEFLPKEVLEKLMVAGVDVNVLSDHSLTLSQRLSELKKLSGQDALLGAMFGQENIVAIQSLLGNLDLLDQYTKTIESDNTALADSAAILGQSYQEQKDRIHAFFEDIKLSVYGATGAMLPFIDVGISGILQIINIAPGIMATVQMFQALGKSQIIAAAATHIMTAAQWLLNAAFWANPIVWITAIVIGLIAAIVWAYNEFDTFRAVIDGLGETFIVVFDSIWKAIKLIYSPIRLIVGFLTGGVKGWKEAKAAIAEDAEGLTNNMKDIVSGGAFKRGYDNSLAKSEADKTAEGQTTNTGVSATGTVPNASSMLDNKTTNPAAKGMTITGSGSGGGKSITMNVEIKNYFNGIKNDLDIKKASKDISDEVLDRMRDSLIFSF